jgi:transposase
MLLADRGYDADWIRAYAAAVARGPISLREAIARSRSASALISIVPDLIERFFNKIKHYRRVATRYDRLAVNYLAFIQLA